MHSKSDMWHLVTAYCLAIKTLILNCERDDRAQLALAAVQQYGLDESKSPLVIRYFQDAESLAERARTLETRYWRGGYHFNIDVYNPQNDMGHVKHSFVLSLYCLMRCPEKEIKEVYNWAMMQTTLLGGDTDTNAAIVGGVVGAYAGIDNIDASKK